MRGTGNRDAVATVELTEGEFLSPLEAEEAKAFFASRRTPYDVSELGIGAADCRPTFAPISERLDDRPSVRWSLWALERLGYLAIAAGIGIAFGMLMFILHSK